EQFLAKKTLYLDAPTGSGKTHLIKLLAQKLDAKVDLLMPTTALAEQQTSLVVATGEKPLSREQQQAQVLATCYESIGKARQRQATVLVVDEAHELATAYSYRSRTIQEIQRYASDYEYVIYLSGSMFPLTTGALANQHVLRFQPAQQRAVAYDLVELDKVSDSEYFASQVQAGRLNVFYKNNKEELQALYTILTARGLRVALVTADEKQADAYQSIVYRSTLAEYDVLLTTCLIQAGVNVNDEQAVHIVFAKGCNLMDYIQFVARFRLVKPSVAICHGGKLGIIPSVNISAQYQLLQAEAAHYQAAAKLNAGLEYGEQSFVSMRAAPVGVIKINGYFRPDTYWLLSQTYEAASRGCVGNKNLLDAYLARHNFHQVGVCVPEADQVKDELVVSAKKQVQKVSKERMAEIVNLLFASQLIPKTKAERDVVARFNFLSMYLDRSAIQAQPAWLIKEATYRRQHNRLAYLVSRRAVAMGLALKEATRIECEKLMKLEKMVGDATSLAPALAYQYATSAFGKLSEKAAHEKLAIIFQFEKVRLQQQGQRSFQYAIQGKHKLKAISTDPDPELDFFFE
ncbi:MAG: AAA family ATPase, partial [Hymenobacter sp.]